MSNRRRSYGLLAASAAVVLISSARDAHATDVLEFPDNGSEQMARGGAWLARASDPLAAFYNPAGLAGQDTKLTLQANLAFEQTCFTRVKAAGDTTLDPLLPSGSTYPKVCNDFGTFPNPQIGFNWRVNDRVGLGFLFFGPSGVAGTVWPEFVQDSKGTYQPSPQRYLLLDANTLLLTPTIAAGFEVVDNLRLGASFQWGIATAQFSNASMGLNQDSPDPRSNDIKAQLSASQPFIPGFTIGALWSPAPVIDVAAWFKWSAPIDADADVKTSASYWNLSQQVIEGDTKVADCGTGNTSVTVCKPGIGHIKVPIPMEAKIGFRFHVPRSMHPDPHHRDPLSQDKWDVGADFTWANDSSFDNLEIRFPGDAQGNGVIPVNGTGGTLPPNADVPHHFSDVFGVRVGGDYNVIPDRLAVRAGAFIETPGQDKQFQNIDFTGGPLHGGLALGATLRIPLKKGAAGEPSKGGALEFSLGYMHMFIADSSNNDPNASGIRALAGTPCITGSPTGGVCNNADGTTSPAYRSTFPINLGTIESSLNVINLGASYRF